MKCPKCSSRLFTQTIVKYRDRGGFRFVGKEVFCPRNRPMCNFQRDIK